MYSMSLLRNTRVITAAIIGSLLVVLTVSASVFAADQLSVIESITLSPTSKHYQLQAGETKKDTFTIVNDGKEDYTFTVYARPYSVASEAYTPDFVKDVPNADVYQWVQFDKPTYRLKAGASVEVNYTVRVPKNARPGGHYGVLFAETQPVGKQSGGSSVERKKRLGVILYMTVKGTYDIQGKSDAMNVAFFQTRPPITASQRVTNSGNTDFMVSTSMKLFDVFGTKKLETKREVSVLPQTTRKILSEVTPSSWFGLYKVELTTKYLKQTDSETHYVLLSPLWVYIVVVLVIGARIAYALAQRKRS